MEMLGQIAPMSPEVCELPPPIPEARDLDITSSFCDRGAGGCGHPLTVHTAGLILHGKCRLAGCSCNGAKLTPQAKKRVAREVMA